MENLNRTTKCYQHKKFDKLREELNRNIRTKYNMRKKASNKKVANAISTTCPKGKRGRKAFVNEKLFLNCLTPAAEVSLSPITDIGHLVSTSAVTETSEGAKRKRTRTLSSKDVSHVTVDETEIPYTPSSMASSVDGNRRKNRKSSDKENTHFVHITADDDADSDVVVIDSAESNAVAPVHNVNAENSVKARRARLSSTISTPPSTSNNSVKEVEQTNTMEFGAIKSRLRTKPVNSKYSLIMNYLKTMGSD